MLPLTVFSGLGSKYLSLNKKQVNPADTRRQKNIVTTSFLRFDVASTSIQRRSNVGWQERDIEIPWSWLAPHP